MNLTVATWCVVFIWLVFKSFQRPSYAIGVYMLTFFAHPQYWWWGDILEGYRWNLFAGVLLLGTLLLSRTALETKSERPLSTNAIPIVLLMALNMIVVHVLFAANSDSSLGWLTARLKFFGLFLLIQYAIRDEEDYRIVAMSIALGMAYIGYEATINERGSFSGGRLEGIGAAGVTSSNQLASLFITGLPIAVTLLFTQITNWQKAGILAACGFSFNIVLMCNSRGAFLGLIIGGLAFLFMATGPARKKSRRIVALAAVATFLLLGDPAILSRFMTTFTTEVEQDASAQSRLQFWSEAMAMLADHPLGSGGNSFSEGLGWRYRRGGQGTQGDRTIGDTRAIHNGFLTEAVDWGVQGFVLMILFILAICRTLRRGRRMALAARDINALMVFACFSTSLVAWLVSSVFGDYLNDEWGLWIAAITYAYLRVRMFAAQPLQRVEHESVAGASAASWTPAFGQGVSRG